LNSLLGAHHEVHKADCVSNITAPHASDLFDPTFGITDILALVDCKKLEIGMLNDDVDKADLKSEMYTGKGHCRGYVIKTKTHDGH
jgi:hypothetical protein